MRLGLGLTGRRNGDKPAGSQTENEPAAGQDVDQPAPDQAETAVGGVLSDDTLTEGKPAVSHEEYPPAGSEAEVLAAAAQYESPPAGATAREAAAEPAATRTAVTGKTARRWDLGLGPAIGGL